jgi:hypothetical protein
MDKVEELDNYMNILPKSIQIKAYGCTKTFLKKLMGIFDNSIISFNEIEC